MANKPETPYKKQVETSKAPLKDSVKEPEKKPEAPAYVEKYTINELAEAAMSAFSTDKVIVLAALRNAGKETYSIEEATRIINAFKNKEVSK